MVLNNKKDLIKTFEDLYVFLQNHPDFNILKWLNDSWVGKDKQESLLRLFAGLNLINKIENYHVCNGNFNLKTIKKNKNFKNIFYSDSGKKNTIERQR
jgi:hypothetical protein